MYYANSLYCACFLSFNVTDGGEVNSVSFDGEKGLFSLLDVSYQ